MWYTLGEEGWRCSGSAITDELDVQGEKLGLSVLPLLTSDHLYEPKFGGYLC